MLERFLEVFSNSKVVAVCGAGLSTASGIPDYRGENGVWVKDPRALAGAHIKNYLADVEIRKNAWRDRLSSPYRGARPNIAHYALDVLVQQGLLDLIVTQNVDGLQRMAGTASKKIVEIHGNINSSLCLSCGHTEPMENTLIRVEEGEEDPRCLIEVDGSICGGVIKSTAISFGQKIDPELIRNVQYSLERCDLILVLGSSLTVNPVASIVVKWVRMGKELGIVNLQPTRYDHLAQYLFHEDVGEILCLLADTLVEFPKVRSH
ncbi:NAD-dependent deacetylase [Ferrithrix thermotolerans DSM 19514]|uniref:protein acetyllysine N-acetyltransferase n=1 Tax=Ferrithrix thermotolerans DSM 19514 TaxID=1121881 RepID=A0A1M4XS19_9ACTN|nr:Sir2 family NAD-dependent protein deacetylase [Ferrithrix thermotolerans]SHE96261.1 NAD-dependent deacetylase [Ferrithrix thermotolerans DSM 19514]